VPFAAQPCRWLCEKSWPPDRGIRWVTVVSAGKGNELIGMFQRWTGMAMPEATKRVASQGRIASPLTHVSG
jgi:hypothetical protein